MRLLRPSDLLVLAIAATLVTPLSGCGGPAATDRGSTGTSPSASAGGADPANVNSARGGSAAPGGSVGGSLAMPTVRPDGAIVIGPGFAPTPIIMGGSAGGSVDASTMGGASAAMGYGCIGMMPSAPQHVLDVTAPISHLRIVVDTYVPGAGGSSDTTLMVRLPDGSLWCDDDGGGELQPMVEGTVSTPGRVEVFVGGYSTSGVGARYKVAFTESYDFTHYSIRGVAAPAYEY
jgi:hypothetical protein